MVEKAYNIILEAFADKFDKAGEPYIFHLKRVANPFKEDEMLYTIALLHDILEDCPDWNIDRLKDIFHLRVCMAVESLTKIEGEKYDDYLYRVVSNDDARKVKISDLKDNMNLCRFKRKLTEKDLTRVAKYHDAYLFLSHF
jgi:guanosine-3',5'-bis(diphosphate) 3'-pyrophosphohydrolase